MLTEQNLQSSKPFRARTLIALAIEAAVVALLMQNRDIWFGIPVSFSEQAVFFLIITFFVLVYLIRTFQRIMKDVERSLIAGIKKEMAPVDEAFARAKASLEKILEKEQPTELPCQNETASRPLLVEFELAYQVRVAIDCIRFSIKATEQSDKQPDQLLQVNLQLLDALDRLQSAERSFQRRFRYRSANGTLASDHDEAIEYSTQTGLREPKS